MNPQMFDPTQADRIPSILDLFHRVFTWETLNIYSWAIWQTPGNIALAYFSTFVIVWTSMQLVEPGPRGIELAPRGGKVLDSKQSLPSLPCSPSLLRPY